MSVQLPQQYRWLTTIGAVPRMVGEATAEFGTVELTPARSEFFGNGAVGHPTKSQSSVKCRWVDAVSFSRFGYRHFLASKTIAGIVALVSLLLNAQRPSAVLGRIRAIVVLALQRVAYGTLAHIRQKVSEALAPPLAYRDPAPAVARVFLPMRSIATPLHFRPRGHSRRISIAVDAIGDAAYRGGDFSAQAPATFGFAGAKVAALHRSLNSAFAFAQRTVVGSADYGPASVALSNGRRRGEMAFGHTADIIPWAADCKGFPT